MQRLLINVFLLSLFIFLSGCGQPRPYQWPASTQEIVARVQANGFSQHEYATRSFRLTTFEKLSPAASDTIHVYIEGDGNSWKSRYVLSQNPTPKQPLALELAHEDSHPNVIYLARPCQYTSHAIDTSCAPKYWSSHRYAPEVIESVNEALDQIKAKTNIKKTNFHLIGFSGGASVAALVAAARKDVICLTTIAGDLNHEALGKYHHTTPLTGSLNPITVAVQLKSLPQHHFSGGQDKIVPPWMATQFAKAVNNPELVHVHVFPEVKHHQGWLEHANSMVNLTCQC